MNMFLNKWTAYGFLIVVSVLIVIFYWPHCMVVTSLIALVLMAIFLVSWLIGLCIQPSDPNNGTGVFAR